MDKSKKWFTDSEFWTLNRSFIWTQKRVEMSQAAAGRAASLMGMKPGDSVLDLACGFGRHSLALSRMGYSVTGVDLNSDLVDEASGIACSEGLQATFLCGDMREYVSPDSFDHIIMLYNSFGYFSDPADDARVLANCFASLRHGGKLLLHLHPREGRGADGDSKYWFEDSEGVFYLNDYSENRERTWSSIRWIVLNGNSRREWEYGVRVYGEEEIKALMRSAGFTSLESYSSLKGDEYKSGSLSMYLTGTRI